MPAGTPDLQELTIRIIKESLQDIPIHSGSLASAPYHDFPDSLKVYFGESWQVRRYGTNGQITSFQRLLSIRQSEDYIHS